MNLLPPAPWRTSSTIARCLHDKSTPRLGSRTTEQSHLAGGLGHLSQDSRLHVLGRAFGVAH
jgi:hypothetical protein